MTPQQQANEALALYQTNRESPREVLEAIMANFFVPPVETEPEYEITMGRVFKAMGAADVADQMEAA